MTFSMWGGFQCVGASFGLLAVFLGLQNLLTAEALAARRALGVFFQIPPPIVFYFPAVLCFAVAAVRAD